MGEPLTKEKFIERHSAFFQSIGFDVQFAGCIYYMLGLGTSDIMDYEREDDFVIKRLVEGEIITEYYQVKHSKDGGNMVDSDDDFWKTLDNWQHLYALSTLEEQKTFFTKGKFIILTNKKPTNFLYDKIKSLRDGVINIGEVRTCIKDKMKVKTNYKTVLKTLYDMKSPLLNQFLHKVEIIHFDDFISSMYEKFLEIYNRPINADSVVNSLVGALWRYKQNCNGKFEFSGYTFKQTFKDILQKIALEDKIIFDETDEPDLDGENIDDAQVMIDQLKSIDVISNKIDRNDFILSSYLEKFFRLKNALLRFYDTQLMTDRSESEYDDVARRTWKTIFIRNQLKLIQKDKKNEKIKDDEKIEAGLNTLNKTMDSPFNIAGQKIEGEFAEGWYLKLSNLKHPKVVWHFDWFKKYIEK